MITSRKLTPQERAELVEMLRHARFPVVRWKPAQGPVSYSSGPYIGAKGRWAQR